MRTLMMSKTRARLKVLAITAAFCLAATACSGPATTKAGGGVFTISAAASGPFTNTYNPLVMSSASASGYSAYAIFEPLLQEDSGKGTTKPWLVTSFEWSQDGKALTLHTGAGVKWSDGQPFTAKDVAFTFELLRKYPALNTSGLPLSGAEAVDDSTAVIHFSVPAFQMMWWRTETVPEHQWKDVADPVKFANQNPIGTGPYVLKSFTPQVISLEKNPYYWQPGQPRIARIQYLASDSPSSMLASLRAGSVDWIGATGVDEATVKKLDASSIGYWSTKPNPAVVILVPNFAKAGLDQLPVRKAMDLALDRQQISTVGTAKQNQPVSSPTGLDVQTRSQLIAPEYAGRTYGSGDPNAARKVLTDAGYRLGSDNVFVSPQGKRLSFELVVPSAYPQADLVGMTRVIVPELAAAGIEAKVKSEQQTAWKDEVELGNFELTLRSNGGTPSVYDFYSRIISQDPVGKAAGTRTQLNYGRYPNPAATALLNAYADSPPGSEAERSAVAGIEKVMVDDLPVLPLTFTSGIGLWRTDVASGYPSDSDPYSVPIPGNVNAELVLLNLTPKN